LAFGGLQKKALRMTNTESAISGQLITDSTGKRNMNE